ncbi:hypothetical protein CVT25_007093 [Psilocybe cyanescens]|uniref:Uncharacterized protein n=1 Tax=Psilocybe cyanescens TaxID=93625 RepID=A0A409XRP3_PSICY|nr:hypothetical protein CVT25_007093 [Psilocybe cyanescens]
MNRKERKMLNTWSGVIPHNKRSTSEVGTLRNLIAFRKRRQTREHKSASVNNIVPIQFTSCGNDSCVKIAQFFLNSSTSATVDGVPSILLLSSATGMTYLAKTSSFPSTTRALMVLMAAGASNTSTRPTWGLERRAFFLSVANHFLNLASSSSGGCKTASSDTPGPAGNVLTRSMKD